jgi:hypothetical protein
MRKILLVAILGLGVAAASSLSRYSNPVAADSSQTTAVFDSDGKMNYPSATGVGFSSVPR